MKNVEIDHNGAYQSAYQSGYHLFHQSNQCFNALKCPKIIKKFDKNYGVPPPPCLAADDLTKLIFLQQKVNKVILYDNFKQFKLVFLHQNSKSRHNHEQKVNKVILYDVNNYD